MASETRRKPKNTSKMKNTKTSVPFLYYVKDGVCKSNAQMPNGGESFRGWLSASHVIRNQPNHSKADVEASLMEFRKFLFCLKQDEEVKQKNLIRFA